MARTRIILGAAVVLVAVSAWAQHGAGTNGDWRFYGGDAGMTKYSPLDRRQC
jgi:hypothetical protein